MKKTEWTYYNLHNVLRVRVEKGHPSEYAARFVFGPFQTDPLDEVDLSLQFEPPGIGQHCIASYSYLFTENHVYLKQYKMHIARDGAAFVLAGKRDLVPYIGPVMQWLLMQKDHSMVHSAAVAVGGRGILLPGWGGTGKTSAITCLLKDVADTSFLSDDYTILSAKGELLAYPKAFFIYPYHRGLFPHLFKAKHKPLVPPVLSGLLERIRTVVRPICMAFPRLENLARRLTPEHMQVPARLALPQANFCDKAPLQTVLFVERHSADKTELDRMDPAEAVPKMVGNWYYEQGRCGQDAFLALGATAVIPAPEYFSKMASIIEAACRDRPIFCLRMGQMSPAQIGKAVVDAVREVTAR